MSTHTHGGHDTHDPQKDSDIERDRLGAFLIDLFSVIAIGTIPTMIFEAIALNFRLPISVGTIAGAIASAAGLIWILPRCLIRNGANVAFLTIDPVATFFKKTKVFYWYATGWHISRWYEVRSKDGVVSYSEATEDFDFTFFAKDGMRRIKGSMRLSPDIHDLPRYVASAAVIVSDILDLTKPRIIAELYLVPADECGGKVDSMNKVLEQEFVMGKEKLEKRFSIRFNDITLTEISPSDEVIKAIEGGAEAKGLEKAIATALGRPNFATVLKDMKPGGTLSQDEYKEAFMLAMDLTGNASKATMGRQTYHVKVEGLQNISPELAQTATAVSQAVVAKLTGGNANSSSSGGKNKPSGKSRDRNNRGGK